MEEEETPRTLIRGVLEHINDVDTTVRITRNNAKTMMRDSPAKRTRQQSVKEQSTGRQLKAINHSSSFSETTPRTLIQGFIEQHDSEKTVRKKPRLIPSPSPGKRSPSKKKSRRSSIGGSALRKQATLRSMINRSVGSQSEDPTPRTMIRKILAHGEEETPVVLHRKPMDQEKPTDSGDSASQFLEKNSSNTSSKLDESANDSGSFLGAYLKVASQPLFRNSQQSQVSRRSRMSSWAKSSQDNLSQFDRHKGNMAEIPEDAGQVKGKPSSVLGRSHVVMATNAGEDFVPIMSQDSSLDSPTHSQVEMPDVGSSPSKPRAMPMREEKEWEEEIEEEDRVEKTHQDMGHDVSHQDLLLTESSNITTIAPVTKAISGQVRSPESEVAGKVREERDHFIGHQHGIISDVRELAGDQEDGSKRITETTSEEEDGHQQDMDGDQNAGEEHEIGSTVSPSVSEADEMEERLPGYNITFSQERLPNSESQSGMLSHNSTGIDGYTPIRTPVLPSTGSKVQQTTPLVRTPVSVERRPLVQKRLIPLKTVQNKVKEKTAVTKGKEKKLRDTANLPPRLPASLTRSIFGHFANCRVSKETLAEVEKVADDFWKKTASSLAAFAVHAHRSTIEESDVELLMQRQGLVTDRQAMYTLVENFLPLEYREEIIPIARAGNQLGPN